MLRTRLIPQSQLIAKRLNITMLSRNSLLSVVLSLPGRSTDVGNTVRILEDVLDLFEGLARRLGEEEEDVQEHGGQEDTEDDVGLPADGGESDGDEETQSGVEGPVGGGGQCDGLTPDAEGVQL